MSYDAIESAYNKVYDAIFTIKPDAQMSYDDLTTAIRELADLISETETDETVWSIGEHGEADLSSLVIGAYWHFYEWHAGQSSNSYAALCALGTIFSPGMTNGPEQDTGEFQTYRLLNEAAESQKAA